MRHLLVLSVFDLLAFASGTLHAEIVLSANDGKMALVNGELTFREQASPDTVTIIRVERGVPSVIADIEVPTSVLGPPFSIALSPDERLALVTAPPFLDSRTPGNAAVADDLVSVLDLTSNRPRLIAQVKAGNGAAGLSIAPNGRLALVANRAEGTISVLEIEGLAVRKIDTVRVGTPESGVAHVAIAPSGTLALVSRDGDNTLSLLRIDGKRVSDGGREFGTGLKPYGIAIFRDSSRAVVANVSLGRGDDDTLSIVSLTSAPPRVVNTVSVGQTPEGIALSPDGRWCAVALLNGSNKARSSPFFNPHGKLVLFRVEGSLLIRVAEHPTAAWPQGALFTADSRTLLVGNMTERSIQVFHVSENGSLTESAQTIHLRAGSAALRGVEAGIH